MKVLYWTGGICTGLFCIFCITDCSAGRTRYLECNVVDKQYHQAYTETYSDIDSHGNTHIHTQYHPEEWYVTFENLANENLYDIETSHSYYLRVTNGQYQTVKTRQGKFTGWNYLPAIAK